MIRETRDWGEIWSVFQRFPEFFSGTEALRDDCRYFAVERDGRVIGIVYFNHLEDAVWQGHFLMLEPGHGVISARQAIRKMLESGAERIIGLTPLDRPKALRAAFAAGMKYVTRTPEYHVTEFAHGQERR